MRGGDDAWDSYDAYTSAIQDDCGDSAAECTSGTLPVQGKPGKFWCNPCGLIARSFFTDTFELLDAASAAVAWTQTDISWKGDVEHKFKETARESAFNNRTELENALVTDPDFINWMRPAGLPQFRKLYRIISGQNLAGGTYTLKIRNNYNTEYFEGGKSFTMTTMSSLGPKNDRMAFAYIIFGVLCFLTAVFLVVMEMMHKKKKAV